jgi:hypothetical protein
MTVTLGTVAFGVGEEQLGAVLDDAAVFLRGARQEAGHVDEGDDRDVEAVAEAHEARGLDRGLDVEAAGQHHRLVGDDADRPAVHAGEADDDVLGEVRLDFEEIALVHDLQDQFLHVVGLVGIVGISVSSEVHPVAGSGVGRRRLVSRLLAAGSR